MANVLILEVFSLIQKWIEECHVLLPTSVITIQCACMKSVRCLFTCT
jgi:hypothetical protein